MNFTVTDLPGHNALTITPTADNKPEAILDLLVRAKLSLVGSNLVNQAGLVVGTLCMTGEWYIDNGPLEWLDLYDELAQPAPLILTEPSHQNAFLLGPRKNPTAAEIRDAFNNKTPVGLPNDRAWNIAEGPVAILVQLNGGATISLGKKKS